MGEFKRLESLTLWSTPDKFWIESSKVKTTHLLQVAREQAEGQCQVSMEPHLGQIPASANKKTIYGVLGLHTLPLGQVNIYTNTFAVRKLSSSLYVSGLGGDHTAAQCW